MSATLFAMILTYPSLTIVASKRVVISFLPILNSPAFSTVTVDAKLNPSNFKVPAFTILVLATAPLISISPSNVVLLSSFLFTTPAALLIVVAINVPWLSDATVNFAAAVLTALLLMVVAFNVALPDTVMVPSLLIVVAVRVVASVPNAIVPLLSNVANVASFFTVSVLLAGIRVLHSKLHLSFRVMSLLSVRV